MAVTQPSFFSCLVAFAGHRLPGPLLSVEEKPLHNMVQLNDIHACIFSGYWYLKEICCGQRVSVWKVKLSSSVSSNLFWGISLAIQYPTSCSQETGSRN